MVSDTLPKPNGVVNGLPGLRPEPLRPSNFADANIADIVEQLTLEEAIALTAGVGNWYTAAIPRLGIPALKVRRYLIPRLSFILILCLRCPMDPMEFEERVSLWAPLPNAYQCVILPF
jgi:hypothetical protein